MYVFGSEQGPPTTPLHIGIEIPNDYSATTDTYKPAEINESDDDPIHIL